MPLWESYIKHVVHRLIGFLAVRARLVTYRMPGRMDIPSLCVPNNQHANHAAPPRMQTRRLYPVEQTPGSTTYARGGTRKPWAAREMSSDSPSVHASGTPEWPAPRLIWLLAFTGLDYARNLSCSIARPVEGRCFPVSYFDHFCCVVNGGLGGRWRGWF